MLAHAVSAVRRLETLKILLDQSSLKDIRFSIGALLWADMPFYQGIKGTRQCAVAPSGSGGTQGASSPTLTGTTT